jgi:hypothetical protein
MKKFSFTDHWNLVIRGVERDLYLLRLEESDIQKMDLASRRGSPSPSPQLVQIRADIAKKMEQLMEIKSLLPEAEELDRLPRQAYRTSNYSRAQEAKRNRGRGQIKPL